VASGGHHRAMTVHVSIKQAKDRLSEHIRRIESGERVIVTRRGDAVFEMVTPRRGGINFDTLDR
jgi:antitoxin (DNA-binding transcriptional repressor) of toxin-antitoxin stability system